MTTLSKQSKMSLAIAAVAVLLAVAVILVLVSRDNTASGSAQFGQQQTFGNGITVQVSPPQPADADGVLPEPNKRVVVSTVTVTNNGDEVYDTNQLQTIAAANGEVASGILTAGANMTRPSVPPGEAVSYQLAWMVPTDTGIPFRLEVSTDYAQDPKFFEGQV